MIIVAGTFEVAPEEREAFIRRREDAMRISRAEPGCLDYAFMADPLEPGVVKLYERWESADALAAHLAAMRSRPRTAGGPQPRQASVQQYQISAAGPVGGELTPVASGGE